MNIDSVPKEWSSAFDSITDFVSLHDKEFRIVRANKALSDFVGLKPEELIGKHCHEIFHSTLVPHADCPHAEAMKLKDTVIREFHESKFGLDISVVASPVFDGKGDLQGTIHFVRNITERKKEESFVKRNAEILEMIATGEPVSDIYDAIALMYEARHPGMRCSLLELKGNKLMHGGAPSLPKEYCDAVDGLENGPSVGSCGTSTYTGKAVYVEDI
ncbi:PAS domain S-box protein [bacterium]|nr:PAS domain S-box protein [bacterium]